MSAPEKVVPRLQRRGNLEGGDVATLRIHAGEDVTDGAVLARRIHSLQDDQQRLLLAGVEDFLKARRAGCDA